MKDLASPQNILFFKRLRAYSNQVRFCDGDDITFFTKKQVQTGVITYRAPVYCYQCGYSSGCKCSNGDHPISYYINK